MKKEKKMPTWLERTCATKVPLTVSVKGVEIPTYQTFWERTMKLEEKIDRMIKIIIALSIAVALLAVNVIL